MAIEISIPLEDAEAEELAAMCEALGSTMEVYLHDTIQQALAAQRMRYAGHVQRMAALEKLKAGTGIKIVNSVTREPVIVTPRKPAPVTEINLG